MTPSSSVVQTFLFSLHMFALIHHRSTPLLFATDSRSAEQSKSLPAFVAFSMAVYALHQFFKRCPQVSVPRCEHSVGRRRLVVSAPV